MQKMSATNTAEDQGTDFLANRGTQSNPGSHNNSRNQNSNNVTTYKGKIIDTNGHIFTARLSALSNAMTFYDKEY